MARIPYDVVAIEANKLTRKMLSARSPEEMEKLYDLYIEYLNATGWDPISFDQETLSRVNEGWEEKEPEPPKSN